MQVLKSEVVGLDGRRVLKRGWVKVTENMHDSAAAVLFILQSPAEVDASRAEIDELRETIAEKGSRALPPLIVEERNGEVYVKDGNHRVIALWEEGITHHPAVFLKPRA